MDGREAAVLKENVLNLKCAENMVKIDLYKGECDKTVAGRKCKCHEGWTGKYCTKPLCIDLEWCHPNGKCKIKNLKHFCACSVGWEGKNCSTPTCKNINKCGQNGLTYIN